MISSLNLDISTLFIRLWVLLRPLVLAGFLDTTLAVGLGRLAGFPPSSALTGGGGAAVFLFCLE